MAKRRERRSRARESAPRVLGYARLSPRPEEGFGLDVQAARMRSYAGLYEIDLVEILTEPELVSAATMDRPALREALRRLDEGQADGILVAKLDRLTRSLRDWLWLIDEYFQDRFALFSVNEHVDTRTANGRMFLNLLVMIAQWERETIGERTSDALQRLRERGVKLGRVGVGYERTDERDGEGRLVIREVEDELETLYRIMELRGEGRSYREIAEIMQAEKVPTKNGGMWHAATVRKILLRAEESE